MRLTTPAAATCRSLVEALQRPRHLGQHLCLGCCCLVQPALLLQNTMRQSTRSDLDQTAPVAMALQYGLCMCGTGGFRILWAWQHTHAHPHLTCSFVCSFI
jgi:hypothetical protein